MASRPRCEALMHTGNRGRCSALGELRSDGRVRCWVHEQAALGGFRPVAYSSETLDGGERRRLEAQLLVACEEIARLDRDLESLVGVANG